MRKSIWYLIRKLKLGFILLQIHPKSAIRENGWFISFSKKKSIDKDGNAIPWWTYSFNDFIETRLSKNHRILEFGCGGSSIWLGNRVKELISIEDYAKWAEEIRKKVTPNVCIKLVDNMSEFNSYLPDLKEPFDIIIIDNLGNRMNCIINSKNLLNKNGVVIWDNTNGKDWPIIKNYMSEIGFKEISFSGLTPQEVASSKTTLFYKEENCLGI